MITINERIAEELSISIKNVESVIQLLEEGNTVPFIARYRKEVTGGMSDEVLRKFEERFNYLKNMETKRADVIRLIKEQGKLTDEIVESLNNANTITEIDDIYRPFKPKRRTRATIAIEKGLEPLANLILESEFKGNVEEEAKKYINKEFKVNSSSDAINGALDIISEKISEDPEERKWIRKFVLNNGTIEVKGESDEKTPYEMYYDHSEAVKTIPSHRILAINRGEKEKILKVKIETPQEKIILHLKSKFLKGNFRTNEYIESSIEDSLKRLIYPSIEREVRTILTERGEEGAIHIFKENLKALLLQPPIKDKVVLGYDPGFRTGCKIAVLDETGKFLDKGTIYPTAPKNDVKGSIEVLKGLIEKYNVEVIALGNGTASRESEEVITDLIKKIDKEIFYVIVSEAGASVYSASTLATKEYPDLDVSIRGAISIGRRLQDPLAELVKIDPKAIGVGQYQHDINKKKLEDSLAGVVEDSVNSVGVDANIATPSLLSYIAGINMKIAENIVELRDSKGKFKSRSEIKKAKGLGPKAYEQCAGFLRISGGKEPLDNTGVHPESYASTKKFIEYLGYSKKEIENLLFEDIDERLKDKDIKEIAKDIGIGEITLNDIIKEIKKPGRDIREELPKPIFKTGIVELEDLTSGMILMGTVRNVSDFGAFVDIGVHQDGLVHKSEMSNKFIKHPLEIVKIGDVIEVQVLEVEKERRRISLTMKVQRLEDVDQKI